MYGFLEFIKIFTEELETKTKKHNEEVDNFSSSKLKKKELLEKERSISIQSNNDYFSSELTELQKEKQGHHDSLEKLKVEISVFDFNYDNFSENPFDKSEYDNNDFSTNIKKLFGLISDLKSNNSSKDNGLLSKVFNSNGADSFDVQLMNRIIFGLRYLENKESSYYNSKISELEKNKKIEIERVNQKYNRLLNENLNVSYNGRINVDNNSYNEILKRNKILCKDEESDNIGLSSPFYYEFNYSSYNELIIKDIEYRLGNIVDTNKKVFKIPFIQEKDIFFINYDFQNNNLFTFLENLQSSFLFSEKVGEYEILDFGFNINRNISNNFFHINNILEPFILKIKTSTELIEKINNNSDRKKIAYIESNVTSIREILEIANNVNLENILLVILNDATKNKVSNEQLMKSNNNIFSIFIDNKITSGNYNLKMFPRNNTLFIEKIKNEYGDYLEKKTIDSVKLTRTLKEINNVNDKSFLIETIRNVIKKRNTYTSRELLIHKERVFDTNGIYLGDYIYDSKFISSRFKTLIVSQLSRGINSNNVYIPFFIDPIEKGMNIFVSGKNPSGFIKNIVLSSMEFFPVNGIEYSFYNDFASSLNLDFFIENKEGLENTFKFIFKKDDLVKYLSLLLEEGQKEIEKGNDSSNRNIIDVIKSNPQKGKKIKYIVINNADKINDSKCEDLIKKCLTNSDRFGIYFILHSEAKELFVDEINLRFYIANESNNLIYDKFNIPINFKIHRELKVYEFLHNYGEEVAVLENKSFGFNNIMPKVNDLFKNSTKNSIVIPVGKNEEGQIQNFVIGDGSYHALISGATGSGKTVFLHTLIMSILFNFNSDEINLYLLDFKGGTEFKIYDNYLIPQVKVLALDAMQEFGESILENIISIMEERAKLFKEASVSKYSDYIDNGRKLPRLLIIIDEFQILYNLASNRKVANNSAELTKRIVTEGRSFGIHLIMSTQSTKILSELSLSSGTIEQMRIRVGLKLSESDSNYMFGSDNADIALNKMRGPVGTAVYSKEFMELEPKGFRVAYIPTDVQNRFLHYISSNLIHDYKENALVFEGEKIPDISELLDRIDFKINNTALFLGERIRISPPLFIECTPRRNNNLLIAGDNEKTLEKVIKLVIFSVNLSNSGKIYFFDEDSTFLQQNQEFLSLCDNKKIFFSEESEDFEDYINSIFSEYTRRKNKKETASEIFLLINNVHFSDTFQDIINGDFIESAPDSKEEEVFSFFSTANKYLSEDDKYEEDENSYAIPIKDKLTLIIKDGYKYNIHTIISLNDWYFYYDNLFDFRNSFKNKIIYSLSQNDAEKFIPDIDITQLKVNMAIYSDGMREKSQFKPYQITAEKDFHMLANKIRRLVYYE